MPNQMTDAERAAQIAERYAEYCERRVRHGD